MFSRFCITTRFALRQSHVRLYAAMSTSTYDRVQKRLIVACDGTWQSSVSGERNIPSNVTRLCRHLAGEGESVSKDGTKTLWKQVVHYDAGIGTGTLTPLDVDIQGGTGAGLAHNVIEAYNFLVLNYQPGDKIYCFGFSRGAYTARSLAGFVTSFGICSQLDMQAFPVIYTLYEKAVPWSQGERADTRKLREKFYGPGWRNSDDGPPKQGGLAWDWLHGNPIPVELGDEKLGGTVVFKSGERSKITKESMQVEVVGVWDTVGALGVPKIFGWLKLPFKLLDKPSREFHDVSINENVHHAFHALALDERRRPFAPTLWYVPNGQVRPLEKSFKQVWFPGCHINVGGGSDDTLEEKRSDFEQIANVTFAWMVEQVRPYLTFDEHSFEEALVDQKRLLEVLEKSHLPWPKSIFSKIHAAPHRLWCWLKRTQLMVSVNRKWGLGPILDSYSNGGLVMWLGMAQWRSPGEQKAPTDIANRHNVQNLTDMGRTGEEIHPSVWYRIQQTGEKHKALKDWERTWQNDGWVWTKKGHSTGLDPLPEYRIKPESGDASKPKNLERLTAQYGGASEYLDKLDEMYEAGHAGTDPNAKLSV